MRRCLIGDLLAAASAVGCGDAAVLQKNARQLLAEADAAHRYSKRFARPHPLWGNGSLMARAMAQPVSTAANFSDPDYLAAFVAVTSALAAHRHFARHQAATLPL